MKDKRYCFFIVLFALCWPILASATANIIQKISVNQLPNGFSLDLQTQFPAHYQNFALHNPPRLVVDIQDGRISDRRVLKVKNTLIRQIRYANKKNHVLRLVFDLNISLTAQINQQNNHLRLRFSAPVSSQPAVDNPVAVIPPHSARKITVVIDPGHGGHDPGATGPQGIHEKTVVLAISRILCQLLNQQPGFNARLTRNTDTYLTLRQRLTLARQYKGDLFIAIHADAYPNKAAHGASVYALSLRGATSEAARWLAKRENESELISGIELNDKSQLLRSVLLNLSQAATIRDSLGMGNDIMTNLADVGSLHQHKVEQAAFVVLKSPDIPSLLIETGFISNAAEEKNLINPVYQQRLAAAIVRGIQNYFKQVRPQELD